MKLRTVLENTVADMLRYGWVILEYQMMQDEWHGRDEAGNTWIVYPPKFGDGLKWLDFNADHKWYRCCKPVDLVRVGALMIPKRNVSDNRN